MIWQLSNPTIIWRHLTVSRSFLSQLSLSVTSIPFLPASRAEIVQSFSVQTRPSSTSLLPPPPAEYALPDCNEEVAPSSVCSLEPPGCPGCTEEELGSSLHPPSQPRPQSQGSYQAAGCLGTPRTMEGTSSVCRGKDMQYISSAS